MTHDNNTHAHSACGRPTRDPRKKPVGALKSEQRKTRKIGPPWRWCQSHTFWIWLAQQMRSSFFTFRRDRETEMENLEEQNKKSVFSNCVVSLCGQGEILKYEFKKKERARVVGADSATLRLALGRRPTCVSLSETRRKRSPGGRRKKGEPKGALLGFTLPSARRRSEAKSNSPHATHTH